ncbi:MAG: 50S ribosomal protein L11 methyltransferase [Clostridia bacterium]|nr:50S ribosomal protein L11 methyltransferase [Clostridia bacterium]
MNYIELTVHTTTEASEIVADIMWNYSDFGVTICDINDVIALQTDKATAYWDYMDDDLAEKAALAGVDGARGDVLVKCYLEKDEADHAARSIMSDIFTARENAGEALAFGTLEDTKREVNGDDWIDVWKKHFRPIHLGKIVVVPEWIEYEAAEDERVVLLDSNMAFGTGEHETTSMCVELMQEYITPESVCIDVGCGSGILGISAIKLGAEKAYLTDIDPVAVSSATHNAALNGVSEKTVVAHSNLLDDTAIVGDIMMANITGEILKMLAPSIPKNLKKEGVLILSGIIESRLEMVVAAYAEVGMKVIREVRKGEWFALVLKHSEE